LHDDAPVKRLSNDVRLLEHSTIYLKLRPNLAIEVLDPQNAVRGASAISTHNRILPNL
jgi:Uma2 family endonuclease